MMDWSPAAGHDHSIAQKLIFEFYNWVLYPILNTILWLLVLRWHRSL